MRIGLRVMNERRCDHEENATKSLEGDHEEIPKVETSTFNQ